MLTYATQKAIDALVSRGRIEEARSLLEGAIRRLEDRRARRRDDPRDRDTLARQRAQRASFRVRLGDLEGAREDAEAAIALAREPNAAGTRPLRTFVAVASLVEGALEACGRIERSLEIQREAIEVLEASIAIDPADLRLWSDLAEAQVRLGNVLRFFGNGAAALAQYRSATERLRALVERDPAELYRRFRLSRALRASAEVLVESGRGAEALGPIEEADGLTRGILAREPAHAAARVTEADLLSLRAQLLEREGRREEAITAWRRAVDAYRGITASVDNDDSRQRLARAERSLATALVGMGRGAEAAPFAEAAVTTLEELMSRAGAVSPVARDLSIAVRALGDARLAEKRHAEATALYERCRDLARPLHDSNPEIVPWLTTYGQACNRVGLARWEQKRFEDALAAFTEAARVGEDLVRRAPSDAGNRRDLATNLVKVGDCQGYLGRHTEARAAYRMAVATIEERLGMGTPPAAAKREAAIVHRRLAGALRFAKEEAAAEAEEARARELDPPRESLAPKAPTTPAAPTQPSP